MGYKGANDIVNVALVGCGGMGMGVINNLKPFEDVRVVAVADPIGRYQDDFFYKRPVGREVAAEEYTKFYGERFPGFVCKAYEDFRVMLDEMDKDIDAVVCATPKTSPACCAPSARGGRSW